MRSIAATDRDCKPQHIDFRSNFFTHCTNQPAISMTSYIHSTILFILGQYGTHDTLLAYDNLYICSRATNI